MNWLNHPRIRGCVRALEAGEVVAYPTEAVWGLGCDPFNDLAIQKILNLKCRPMEKGLILIAGDVKQFAFLLQNLEPSQRDNLRNSWPGHTTWLVPHHNLVSPLLCGVHATIALRVSRHPLVQALCKLMGGPIVSTSANPQGLPTARDGLKARSYFGPAVVYSPAAPLIAKEPSEIKDLITGKVIRSGETNDGR